MSGTRYTYRESRDGSNNSAFESPLFERMNTVEELQQCRQNIESLQQRVHDLERINVDLEFRLEDQAKQCMTTEKECISLERKWRAKCEGLESDIESWKRDFDDQKLKTERLREHLSRTERELYSILQRKHELMRGAGRGSGSAVGPLNSSVIGGVSVNSGLGTPGANRVEQGHRQQRWEMGMKKLDVLSGASASENNKAADDIFNTQQVCFYSLILYQYKFVFV